MKSARRVSRTSGKIPVRAVQPKTLFSRTAEIVIGSVVFDRDYEMPGTVRNIDGERIELQRPTGLVWAVHFRRLRPATDHEQQQLVAIGKLHRQQQRGQPYHQAPTRRAD